jgi:uncharacterized protein (DUF1499 family)
MKIVLAICLLTGFLVAVMYFFPQINFREMPQGLIDGTLSEDKPNWVSSLVASDNSHYIASLNVDSLEKLAACIKSNIPDVTITKTDETGLFAYRQSRVFHFVDWFIIRSNGAVISSATIGHSDFGKNRELIEQIRALCV